MRYFGRVFLAGIAVAGAALAQSNSYPAQWDVQRLVDALVQEAQRLPPILEQANPAQWNDAAAGQSYQAQWKAAQNEIQYFTGSARSFSKQPEKMPLALETYFRMEAMEASLGSLAQGIRRHHNPAVADLLQGVMTENSNNRERLKQYLTDLATAKEQEFQIADREAQRCRSAITHQPPAPSRSRKQE